MAAPDSVVTTNDTKDAESGSNGSFAMIIVAVFVLIGGVVYAVSAFVQAEKELEQAEVSAADQVKGFDPTEFTSQFSPDSIPFVDDEPDVTATAPVEPDVTSTVPVEPDEPGETGPHPGVDIDPDDIAMAFVSRIPGDDYGKVGYVTAEAERFQTELECVRLDLNKFGGLCLASANGFTGSGNGLITNSSLVPIKSFGLNSPNRAAVSPDGSLIAWTGFTFGDSYLEAGAFATITQLISLDRGRAANLERSFKTFKGGEPFFNNDRNYWGVTFVDNDLFYATVGSRGGTDIVEGRVSTSRLDVIIENATCPEVSPDGKTLVAKERGEGIFFQLIAIDLETGERRNLGETRSVEDQVEFLDNDTVVYALPNTEEGTDAQPAWDIWALDLAPGSTPTLIVPFADSPAV